MNLRTVLKLAAGVAAATVLGLVAASQTFGQEASVQRVTVAPGTQGTVAVQALDIGSPGLGAWEIDVIYNAGVVTAVSCSAQAGSVCNVNFATDRVRIVGASASGHTGDTTLATITFACGSSEGTSPLALGVAVFADATTSNPQPIGPAIDNGSVSCSFGGDDGTQPTQQPSTDEPDEDGAGPTPAVALPDTGSGPSGGGVSGWLIAALAASGLALLAGFGALKLRFVR